jgi:restriction endonuclease S subunit
MYLKFEDKFEKVEHKMENIELKQEKEYQHLLKNVKYVSNFLEENLNKDICKPK